MKDKKNIYLIGTCRINKYIFHLNPIMNVYLHLNPTVSIRNKYIICI